MPAIMLPHSIKQSSVVSTNKPKSAPRNTAGKSVGRRFLDLLMAALSACPV